MPARLVLTDVPGAWVKVSFRGREFRARMDPMWLGPDQLARLLERPQLVWQLLDDRDRARILIADPFGRHTVSLLMDYMESVGLGLLGMQRLIYALNHLDELEVDLLRMGLDVRDWLDTEAALSSRRVALLVEDFQARPETRLGALYFGIYPMSKSGMVAAQALEAQSSDKEFRHPFLKSPELVEAEAEQRREEAARRERIKNRGF